MTTEDQSLPIRPLVPFTIRGEAEEPALPAFQILRQAKACSKAKPVSKAPRGERNLGDTVHGWVAAQASPVFVKGFQIVIAEESQGPKGDIERARRMSFGQHKFVEG